jgi:ATP-dependent RNA helicase DDX23/PRP28
MAAPRTEPLSIETLLQKQKAEKEAAAKVCRAVPCPAAPTHTGAHQPKFLSREERAALAIAKRADELRVERTRAESTQQARQALEREADELRRREREREYSGRHNAGPASGGRCACLLGLRRVCSCPARSR